MNPGPPDPEFKDVNHLATYAEAVEWQGTVLLTAH